MKNSLQVFQVPIHKKIVYMYLEPQSNTATDSLYTNVIICKLKKFGNHFTLV